MFRVYCCCGLCILCVQYTTIIFGVTGRTLDTKKKESGDTLDNARGWWFIHSFNLPLYLPKLLPLVPTQTHITHTFTVYGISIS